MSTDAMAVSTLEIRADPEWEAPQQGAAPKGSASLGGLRAGFGIRRRLVVAFGVIAGVAGVIATYSLLSFHSLGEGMAEFAFGTMPALVAAHKLVDDSNYLLVPIQSLALARTEAERHRWRELSEERRSSLVRARDQLARRFSGG